MPLRIALALVAVLVTAVTSLGIGVRSTYGGRAAVDEPEYLMTALSLGEDGDLDISDELRDRRWRAFHDVELPVQTAALDGGRRISPHDPLLPAVLALPMRWGGYVAAKATLAALAGILAALTCWVAIRRLAVPVHVAIPVVLLLSLSPPLGVYATQVYPELPAALAAMAAVAALTGRLGRRALVALGTAVSALPWLSVKYVPVAAALAGVAVVRLIRAGSAPTRRAAVTFSAGLAVMALGYLVAHRVLYGGWTSYATGDTFTRVGEFAVVGRSPDLAGRSTRIVGLLADRGFGLVGWQPAWLLVVPAVTVALRDRVAWRAAVLLPLAAGYLTAALVALTAHGYWWPGRQLVVVLPLAVLALCAWCAGDGRRYAVTVGVGLVGVVTFGLLLVEGHATDITWVTGFERTGAPAYRALRHLLPEYRDDTPARWILHVAWTVVLASLVAWSARRRPSRRAALAAAGIVMTVALAGGRMDDGSDVRDDDGHRDGREHRAGPLAQRPSLRGDGQPFAEPCCNGGISGHGHDVVVGAPVEPQQQR